MGVIKLSVLDKLVYVNNATSEQLKLIDNLLSYRIDGAFFSKLYRMGRWDGKKHLFNSQQKYLSLGLLYRLEQWLKLEKIEYEIEYKQQKRRPLKDKYLKDVGNFTLRNYQIEALETFIKQNSTRGIFELPPRSGKTLIMGTLGLILDTYPILFIVHRIDLALQTKDVFEKLFEFEIGIVGDGKCNINSPVVISTIQSIATTYDIKLEKEDGDLKETVITEKEKFKTFIGNVKTVFGDEAHCSSGNIWQELPKHLKSVIYCIGCSGTPYREDGSEMLIEKLFGPIIYSLPREEAVKHNTILPIKSYFIYLPEVSISKYDVQTQKQEGLNKNEYLIDGVIKLVKQLEKKNLSSVIMVREKSQGNLIHDKLNRYYLHGGIGGDERKRVYDLLRQKETLTIISTVTDVGVDIPSLDCVIIAGLTKSKVLAMQRIRCGTADGKKKYGKMFIFCPRIEYPNDMKQKEKYIENWHKKLKSIYKKEPTIEIEDIEYNGKDFK